MKLTYILLALGISMFGYAGYKKYSASHKSDKAISIMTASEAQVRKLCASNNINSRIECMEPKFEKMAIADFPVKFSVLINGEKSEITATTSHNLVKIKRIPGMSFGGSCMSTFYYFDFDAQDLYLSKDNLSGVMFCQNGSDKIAVYPSSMSDDSMKDLVKKLMGVTL